MEGGLFENVSEDQKSQFIGDFFNWMRTAFKNPGHFLMQKSSGHHHKHLHDDAAIQVDKDEKKDAEKKKEEKHEEKKEEKKEEKHEQKKEDKKP